MLGKSEIKKLEENGDVEGLIEALEIQYRAVGQPYFGDVVASLASLDDKRATEALLDFFEDHILTDFMPDRVDFPQGTPGFRNYMKLMGALASIGKRTRDKMITEAFIKTLNSDFLDVQNASVSVLATIGDDQAVEALIKRLDDLTGNMQQWNYVIVPSEIRNVIMALGETHHEKAVDVLIRLLRVEKVRMDAHVALKELIKNGIVEPLIDPLIKLLDEKNLSAITLLGEIDDVRAIEPLCEVLEKSKGWQLRLCAVEALGKIADEKAVPFLTKALKDEEELVQREARKALEKIGSKKPSS